MNMLPLSEAKIKFSELVEKVYSGEQKFIITKDGKPSAMLINPDLYESLKETIEIKSNYELMSEIKKGLDDLKKNSKIYTLEELFEEV
jgi:antitoxin YefM